MKHAIAVALGAGLLMLTQTEPAEAGAIRKACLKSDRSEATPQLCGCIQKVANHSLNLRERKKVAKWFADPHRAQEIRQSDKRADERLWQRYRAFGEQAQETCG